MVPEGTLAVDVPGRMTPQSPPVVRLVSLDGTPIREVVRSNNYFGTVEMRMAWSRDGSKLHFHDLESVNASLPRLYVSDLAGGVTVLPVNPGMYGQYNPEPSADG
jgi:hypothetical protein